jgi:porphobilinogen deaminase
VAALATLQPPGSGGMLLLHGRVLSLDGSTMMEMRQTGPAAGEDDAARMGVALAEQLLAEGAGALLERTRTTAAPGITEP